MDGLIEQRHPSLAQALTLLETVRAEAERRSLALAAAVVDASGHVIASQRMDGSALGAMRLADGKAYTAALWGTRTGYFTETQPGGDWGWNATARDASSSTRERSTRTAGRCAVGRAEARPLKTRVRDGGGGRSRVRIEPALGVRRSDSAGSSETAFAYASWRFVRACSRSRTMASSTPPSRSTGSRARSDSIASFT